MPPDCGKKIWGLVGTHGNHYRLEDRKCPPNREIHSNQKCHAKKDATQKRMPRKKGTPHKKSTGTTCPDTSYSSINFLPENNSPPGIEFFLGNLVGYLLNSAIVSYTPNDKACCSRIGIIFKASVYDFKIFRF